MWEIRNSGGLKRKLKVNRDFDKRCPICGQYFKKDEDYYLIIPPSELKREYKKLSLNLIVHCEEWDLFLKDIKDEKELAFKIQNLKTPRKKSFSDKEKFFISSFKKACWDFDFKQEFIKPNGLKMKKKGSSLCLIYNVYTDYIHISYNGKLGLFDRFYMQQIVTNVFNRMHEYIEDGKKDNYSASEEIKKVFDKVNDILK